MHVTIDANDLYLLVLVFCLVLVLVAETRRSHRLSNQLSESESSNNALRESLEGIERERKDLRNSLTEAKARNTFLDQSCERIWIQLKDLKKSLAEAEDRASKLQAQLDALTDRDEKGKYKK